MTESLEQLRQKARVAYKKIGSVKCPYFKEEIMFNSEGFNHIRYRAARRERHLDVQKMRYTLLKFAQIIIGKSQTLQEHNMIKQFVETEMNKRKESVLKEVHFYGFIAIIDGWKVKVIVRQIGNGKKHFWSIIPNWRTRKSKEGRKSFENYTGNLAED